MALVTTGEVMTALGVPSGDPTVVARYDQLRVMVEAAIKSWCKWGIEAVIGQVEFFDGNGFGDISLRHPFVNAITEVKLDATGAYGTGPNAFAATALVQGTDYALRKEGTLGKSGLLRKLTSTSYFFPSDMLFRGRSGLSYYSGAYWPAGIGNVKVTYNYGFAVIPDDIKLAVVTAIGIIRQTIKTNFPLSNESLGDYSYGLATGLSRDTVFGDVRQLLAFYRDEIV